MSYNMAFATLIWCSKMCNKTLTLQFMVLRCDSETSIQASNKDKEGEEESIREKDLEGPTRTQNTRVYSWL